MKGSQIRFPFLSSIFTEIKDRKINYKGIEHTLIEGDNLAALKKLKPHFKEKVDVIYIDPPYNTSRTDFNYTDKFKHRDWQSFMEKRLKLA